MLRLLKMARKPGSVFVFIICVFLPILGHAQITGVVIDHSQTSLAGASVSLMVGSDTTLLATTGTDETGRFRFNNAPTGTYTIRITSIGYLEHRSPAFVFNQQELKELDTVHLMQLSHEMQQLLVRAERPAVRQSREGIVLNVENSILAKGNSILQVLERSPGVVINRRDNTIQLNGKSGVMVMINGKVIRLPESQLIDWLNGMSADNMASLEILNSPGARYDAEGSGGLINIVMKQNRMPGTSGSINVSAGYGLREKSGAAFNISRNRGRLNLNAGYTMSYNHTYSNMSVDSWQHMPFLGGSIHALGQDTSWMKIQSHSLNFGGDLKLNTRTSFGASVILGHNATKAMTNTHLQYYILPDSLLSYDGKNAGRRRWNNLVGSMSMTHVFNDRNTTNLAVDYLYFGNDAPYQVNGVFVNKHGEPVSDSNTLSAAAQLGFANTTINVGVFKLDHNIKVTEKMTLDFGLKWNRTNNNSVSGFESLRNGVWTIDAQAVNNTRMSEDIGAAYFSLQTYLNPKLDIVTGLRYEYAITKIHEPGSGQAIRHRKQGSFFPNISLVQKINKSSTLQLSYSKRISRPTYNDLASYIVYNDPTAVYTGNPFLKPAISSQVKFGYTYKNYLVSVVMGHDENLIARYQLSESPQRDMLLVSPHNIAWQKSFGVQAMITVRPTDFWYVNATVSGTWMHYRITHTKIPGTHRYFNMSPALTQTIKFKEKFSAEFFTSYNSRNFNGSQRVNGILRFNIGVRKQLGEKSSLQLSVSDILGRELYDIRYGTVTKEAFDISNRVVVRTESTRVPVMRLTFVHSFGTPKSSPGRKTIASDEQERVRKD